MTAEPVATPLTTPPEVTEAIPALLVAHVPPETEEDKVTVLPTQTTPRPEILPALVVEVTGNVAVAVAVPQLFVTVYEMVAEPPATPVATPEASIVAMEMSLLLQLPPVAVLESVTEVPGHTEAKPVILPALGAGLTDIGADVETEPQLVV